MTELTIRRLMMPFGFIVFLLLVLVLFSVPSHTAPPQQAEPDAASLLAWLPHIRSGPTPTAPAIIEIAYVYYPPSLRKAREYVRIENQGASSQVMTGWKLKNENSGEVYTFPVFSLGSYAGVDVFSTCGLETQDKLYWCFSDHYFPIWDHGEIACVYESDWTQVDCSVVP